MFKLSNAMFEQDWGHILHKHAGYNPPWMHSVNNNGKHAYASNQRLTEVRGMPHASNGSKWMHHPERCFYAGVA